MTKNTSGFSTRAIHAGQSPALGTGAIMTPIYQSSTYVQSSPGVHQGYEYSRTGNPTRTALEENLAALENAKFGICFSSGCAAADALMHLLKTGDQLICGDDVYGGTFRIFDKIYKPLGISCSYVDLMDLKALDKAITSATRVIWFESPTNPLLKLVDIAAVATVAKNKGLLVVVDNTFASPYLQNPLDFGADLVLHSTTKYIGGHSDVVGGAILTNNAELANRLHYIQNAIGAVPAPWDCFLLLRSTKTLSMRMERHCQSALQIAQYLETKNEIEKVIYPGLPNHPQHQLAKSQMRGNGGMITVVLKGGLVSAKKLLEKVKIFSLAESLGGVESLIEHPAIMTHASIPAQTRLKLGISDGLVRLSVGVEDVDDLIQDLQQGLS